MYAGFWYFVTSGTRKATKEMEDEEESESAAPKKKRAKTISSNKTLS